MKQKNKFKKIICSVLSFLLVLACISTFELKVNASASRKKLPYYIDFDAKKYFDVDIVDFHSQLVSLGFPEPTNENYICWLGDFYSYNSSSNTVYFDVYKIIISTSTSTYTQFSFYGLYNSNDSSTPIVNRIAPTNFDYQTNYVVFKKNASQGRITRYTYRWDITNKTVISGTQNPNGYYTADKVFLNGKNPSNKNEYGFTSSVPIWYRYNDDVFMSGEYRIDFPGGYDIYQSFEIYCFGVPFGVPISPDLSGDNITSATTPPTSPTLTTYTPPSYNPPTFDSSDTLSALESLYDITAYNGVYVADYINGAIDNFTNNFKNYIEYLKDVIDFGLQKVINNIKNAIQNMYDNIENFFAPALENIQETLNDIKNFGQSVKDFVDLFIHPFDSTQAQNDINNSAFVSQISTTKTQIQTFANIFSSIQEPNNLIYTFDLTGLFISFGVWEVDLSILSGILPYIRGILACILLYSLIVTIFTSINSYIGGNSSKNDNND